jgi:hypothetical protein
MSWQRDDFAFSINKYIVFIGKSCIKKGDGHADGNDDINLFIVQAGLKQ